MCVYFFICVIHLYFLITENKYWKFKTKILLLPLLGFCYFYNTDTPSLIIFAAIFCGWIGDIVVGLSTTVGIIMFGMGHVLYSAYLIREIQSCNMYEVLFVGIAVFAIGILIYTKLYKYVTKEMKYPVLAYMFLISFMMVTSVLHYVNNGLSNKLIVMGGALFMISDSVLAFEIFRKRTKVGDFIVMFTYILAQTFIVFGCR